MSTAKPNDLEDVSPSPLPSTEERASMVDAGRSLSAEVRLLREQIAQLCQAVRGLVQLQSVANQKLDSALSGKPNFEVL
jgi:hypothetical protein